MTERKHYTREFKFEALELWRSSGKPTAQIERDLGIHKGQLRARKRQFEKHGADAFPGHGRLPRTGVGHGRVVQAEYEPMRYITLTCMHQEITSGFHGL